MLYFCYTAIGCITYPVPSGGIQIFYKPVLSQKYFFSPGSVSTNGTSLNDNAGQFADQVKFREMVL